MDFMTCYHSNKHILMEGALGERLKREYGIKFDEEIAMASLIYSDAGRAALANLWTEYIENAKRFNLPFLATTPTRRANKERVSQSGYDAAVIKDNVDFLKTVREKSFIKNIYIGGLMGCKGDAYKGTEVLYTEEAKEFHYWQARLFAQAGVDFLYAGIMPALSEAIGMARAMEQTGIPFIISFMIRKNGRLIDGTSISDAIQRIDESVSTKPLCYMTNCVHPIVLREALSYDFNQTLVVRDRLKGIQANTSPLSPEELDNSIELKCSDAVTLAKSIKDLSNYMDLKIVGGCCGTDNTHMEEIAKSLTFIGNMV